MTNKERIKKAEELIADFKKLFTVALGVEPVVSYDLGENVFNKLTLINIEHIINKVFKENFEEYYPKEGIRNKSRKGMIISFRFMFFKISRDMNYTLKTIGNYMGYNHASIIHAVKTVENLLDAKDSRSLLLYNLINNEIKKRIGHNGDVYYSEQQESHS